MVVTVGGHGMVLPNVVVVAITGSVVVVEDGVDVVPMAVVVTEGTVVVGVLVVVDDSTPFPRPVP